MEGPNAHLNSIPDSTIAVSCVNFPTLTFALNGLLSSERR